MIIIEKIVLYTIYEDGGDGMEKKNLIWADVVIKRWIKSRTISHESNKFEQMSDMSRNKFGKANKDERTFSSLIHSFETLFPNSKKINF